MHIDQYKTVIFGKECLVELMSFDKEDSKKWKALFDIWKKLKLGMREYKSREPNLPEGLSEVAFCLFSGSKRFISLRGEASTSFDTFNLKTKRAEQIKASSIKHDLTTFGPKSQWDDLYFLDFYNEKKLDGTFNVYKIPSRFILNAKVNKKQTLRQQQKQKRRPRFSITKEIIERCKLKPIACNVKVW
ncbi:MAG: Bsp6I family type II restriction endonuclease [Patescibacteria group bacterium]